MCENCEALDRQNTARVNRTKIDAAKTLFFTVDSTGEIVVASDGEGPLQPTREHARGIKYEGERIARYEFTGYVR